jgi:hypothetical protein
MKSFKMMLAIGAALLMFGCAYTNKITMAPNVGKLEIAKPIPLKVALLITEESKNQIYSSPAYPDFQNDYPQYVLEPYQLPIGNAFEKAAFEIFSQVFQKVQLIRSPEEAKNTKLIFEPRLTDFSLHLAYNTITYRYYYSAMDIRCKAKVIGKIINQGKTIWEKTVETPLETEHLVYSSLLPNIVGEKASDTIILALKGLAGQMLEESIPPSRPVHGWLEEIDKQR